VGSELVWLDLSRTGITDAGLKALSKMPNLERLDLRGTAVGDDGVRTLAPLLTSSKASASTERP
jgi:hypothetical protein